MSASTGSRLKDAAARAGWGSGFVEPFSPEDALEFAMDALGDLDPDALTPAQIHAYKALQWARERLAAPCAAPSAPTGLPPFEQLVRALEDAVRIADLRGDEEHVWRMLIDRTRAIVEGGLPEACGLDGSVLLQVVDDGYAAETKAIRGNLRAMIGKLDRAIPVDPTLGRW